MESFYDKVAKQFGGYDLSNGVPKHTSTYSGGNPEVIFREKILELAEPNCIAMDIGCGDGTFTLSLAGEFKKLVGLDSSKELMQIANQKKNEGNFDNVEFVFGDAENAPFDNESFDMIFNRRGPSFYQEYARLLKIGGYYIEIGVGEKDAMKLKKTFRRGQNYGAWNNSRLDQDKSKFESLGVNVVFARDFMYSESYLSKEEFELLLQRVPIFEDFDLTNDKRNLDEYFLKYSSGAQIGLDRHRVVYVAKK